MKKKINQLTSTVIAGEPFADIVQIGAKYVIPLINNNYVQAIDDLVDMNSIKIPQALVDMGTLDGKFYMFQHEINQSGGMYYNKTMFEQAGLPDPFELQEAGEWTWDAMLDAAKKLTNGTTFGLSGDPNLFGQYFIVSNDAAILNTDTGEVSIDSAAALEGLEFMSSLYNEHRVVKENEGNNWEDPRRYFTEGLVGMTQGWTWEAEGRADTSFEWGYVFWPKGPKATDYVTPVTNFDGMVIPAGVEDAEVVYKIWEDLQLWEIGQEGVMDWFENVLPNVESVKTATKMLDHVNVNLWEAYGIDEILNEMNEAIATGAESPSQAVTRVKGEAQARVNEFLGR
ncbi:MAG: extracellular solute-binding protein [Bacillaceae bacterium]|nr:extracellular solute-binding protein [Bacillaceae bacterium]